MYKGIIRGEICIADIQKGLRRYWHAAKMKSKITARRWPRHNVFGGVGKMYSQTNHTSHRICVQMRRYLTAMPLTPLDSFTGSGGEIYAGHHVYPSLVVRSHLMAPVPSCHFVLFHRWPAISIYLCSSRACKESGVKYDVCLIDLFVRGP